MLKQNNMHDKDMVAQLREDYTKASLDEKDVAPNPFQQFAHWFDEALKSSLPEPNAFTLATVDEQGLPDARVVLLKGYDSAGFVFYTNYNSKKGQDLNNRPYANMTFLWLELQRQVRIRGRVEQVTYAESEEYFRSRPRASQMGALASNQSELVNSRAELEEAFRAVELQFEHESVIPMPQHWGGYRIIPDEIEFWQGRSSRMHDRVRYRLHGSQWLIERLWP